MEIPNGRNIVFTVEEAYRLLNKCATNNANVAGNTDKECVSSEKHLFEILNK